LRPAGIYFGTRSGKLYGSNNDGKSWSVIMDGLPPIACVKTAMVGEGGGKGSRKSPSSKKHKAAAPRAKSRAVAAKKASGKKRAVARAR
jgi:hypothetical protein